MSGADQWQYPAIVATSARIRGRAVSLDHKAGDNRFNGKIKGIQLAIRETANGADHTIEPKKGDGTAIAV